MEPYRLPDDVETLVNDGTPGSMTTAITFLREIRGVGLHEAERMIARYRATELLREADTTEDLETKVECLLRAVVILLEKLK